MESPNATVVFFLQGSACPPAAIAQHALALQSAPCINQFSISDRRVLGTVCSVSGITRSSRSRMWESRCINNVVTKRSGHAIGFVLCSDA
jgi:hypothetical protein